MIKATAKIITSVEGYFMVKDALGRLLMPPIQVAEALNPKS